MTVVNVKRRGAAAFVGSDASKTGMTPQTNRKRILIADDEPVIRMIIRMALGEGYEFVEASDGEEAWEKYAAADPPIDLAIVDLKMPRLGGGEVLRRIAQKDAKVPAILLTGNLEAPIRSQPNVRVMMKPFDNLELVAAVKELLASVERP